MGWGGGGVGGLGRGLVRDRIPMEWLGWEDLTKLILGNYETWKLALTFVATLLKPSVSVKPRILMKCWGP